MDRLETVDPRFERKSTLKIIRSNGDLDDTLNDQGSVLGFGTAAATGNVEPRVKPGTMLYEVAGVPEEIAKEALARIAQKMPVRCRFVGKRFSV